VENDCSPSFQGAPLGGCQEYIRVKDQFMSTTAVFAEILIIGIQAAIWVVLLIISFFGYAWILTVSSSLENWIVPIVVILFSLFYTLGIIIDRLADLLFLVIKPKDFFLKSKWKRLAQEQAHSGTHVAILLKDGHASTFFEYIRSRIRIVRATVVNLFLTLLSALIFIARQCDSLGCTPKTNLILVVILIGISSIGITLLALGLLQITYDVRITQAEQELEQAKKKR
jgi:hypothetical protein